MRTKLITILIIHMPFWAMSQGFGSVAQSNLGGVYSTLSNPANAAGSIDRLSFNLIGVSASVNNNALRTDLDYNLLRIVGRRPLRVEPGSLEKVGVQAPRKWVIKPVVYAEVDALQLAAQIAISKKWSLYGYTRERAFANFDKGDYNSLRYLVEEKYDHSVSQVSLGFDMRTMSYQELAIGGAFQIYERKQHYWKIGATYKRINARAIYAVSVPYIESNLRTSTIEVAGEVSLIQTALSAASQNPLDFILNPAMGSGNALDLGVVYEHRPRSLRSTYRNNNLKGKNRMFKRRNLTKYSYRIGLSLNELGSVRFNPQRVTSTTARVKATFDITELALMTSDDYAQRLLDSSTTESGSSSLQFSLPTILSFSYDQRLMNNWFASVVYRQNMIARVETSFYQPTSLQLQMRKETRKCVFGFPVQLVPATRTLSVGAYAHTGPFFIGTNNLGTLFLKKMYNPSFYTGLSYNIRYKADQTIENHKSFRTKRRRVYPWSGM